MTIDDAIEFERYLCSKTEICDEGFMTCEEHKQIAEWLEELKAIREYVEPLRNTNTHNEYLEKLKELVKQTVAQKER